MIEYANDNGFEEPDSEDIQDLFTELDTNCNGKLTKEEIEFFVEKFESIVDIMEDRTARNAHLPLARAHTCSEVIFLQKGILANIGSPSLMRQETSQSRNI